MLALNLLALGFAAVSTMAFPAVKLPRDAPGPWCNNLGAGAFDEALDITLAAWNATGTNTNSTGAPLVLGAAGAIPGASLRHLATWASFPYNDYPSLSLVNGTLIPHGSTGTPARANVVEPNGELNFLLSSSVDPSSGAQIYCAVADTDPAGHGTGHPFLAVNGDTDSFSLCQSGSQNVVFYKAAENGRLDFASCYPVKVQIIFNTRTYN